MVDNNSNETIESSRAFTLSGSGGILRRFNTQSNLVIIPYFVLTYTHLWKTTNHRVWIPVHHDSDGYRDGYTQFDYENTVRDGSFGGSVGLEIELSEKMSVIGSFAFSFESSDTLFSIGLNFN